MELPLEAVLVDEVRTAVTGGAGPGPAPELTGRIAGLESRFAVREAAVATVAAALSAAADLEAQRLGRRPDTALDRGSVAATVRSERCFRVADQPAGMGFALLSRLWPAADGWIRTHGNYPWHRDALVDCVGVGPDPEAMAAAIAERPALELESTVVAAGGIAAAVRTEATWATHPQGAAVGQEPLVAHRRLGDAEPRSRPAAAPGAPMAGVRVLDLTRVIAGPVATRYLGALGADVLRLDPPHRPDLQAGRPGDTLLGKRSALLDATTVDGRARLDALVAEADVLVMGYRPGALDAFGLGPDRLAERHPGLVVVVLSAWGHSGPWAERRGFDSVVQAPTGIADGETDASGVPGALPCQLLDHGTGYLAAAAALDGVRRQLADGGTHVRLLSLARTAAWLTANAPATSGLATDADEEDEAAHLQVLPGDEPVTAARPPGSLDGRRLAWPDRITRYASDVPAFGR
jgi:hypothetical protein